MRSRYPRNRKRLDAKQEPQLEIKHSLLMRVAITWRLQCASLVIIIISTIDFVEASVDKVCLHDLRVEGVIFMFSASRRPGLYWTKF